jgi:hypothetical protein
MNPSDNGYEYKRISAAGSAALRAVPSVLHTITVEASTGTVTFYDNASGTSAQVVATVGGGAASPETFVYDAQLRRGLYYLATGTPVLTVTVS